MRDNQGRFMARAREDMFNKLNIIYIFYQILPIIILIFCCYHYFDVSTSFKNVLLKLICGNSFEGCICKCGDVNGSSSSYWNSK